MDIKHVLSCNPLEPAYAHDRDHHDARSRRAPRFRPATFVEFEGGSVEVGHTG